MGYTMALKKKQKKNMAAKSAGTEHIRTVTFNGNNQYFCSNFLQIYKTAKAEHDCSNLEKL